MRVSSGMNYNHVKDNIGRNRAESLDLSDQASTMRRINKPSDDPVGTARMLGVRTSKAATEQFLKNIDMAKINLNYAEAALTELTEVLVKAKELAISQASDASSSAVTRLAVATEIDHLFQQMVDIGNRKFGEKFIFGGFKTRKPPFMPDGKYVGDGGSVSIEVNKEVFTEVNVPGDRILTGVDNNVGTIPDDSRGATTPNYPASPSRQKVQVRGPASVNETKKADEETQNKRTKRQDFGGGGENAFFAMRALSEGLRANDGTAIQDTLERLDTAMEQVLLVRSEVGSRISALENISEGLAKSKVDDAALLSQIEDADPYDVFTRLTQNENTLKATLQSSGKLITPSLLDFLR